MTASDALGVEREFDQSIPVGNAGATIIGVDGRGITDTTVNIDGDLILTYTDGTTENAGHVVGATGQQGIQGIQGVQGVQGVQGIQGNKGDTGDTGATGQNGSDGVGVSSASINADGNLIFTKTDGTTTDAGDIVQIVLDALPDGDEVSY